VQGLLAAHVLFAGGMKLIAPVAVLAVIFPFPGKFVRFIGICEVLGAFGLILHWALGIRRELTPLAAAGLVIIMVGATVSTLAIVGGALALVDVVIGVLAASIVYGRRATCDALRPTAPRLQPAAA
jgi:DoxX-like family